MGDAVAGRALCGGDQRHAAGRALLEIAASWAAGRGLMSVTLTTFAEVPWNAPYYERLGFRIGSDVELSRGLGRNP